MLTCKTRGAGGASDGAPEGWLVCTSVRGKGSATIWPRESVSRAARAGEAAACAPLLPPNCPLAVGLGAAALVLGRGRLCGLLLWAAGAGRREPRGTGVNMLARLSVAARPAEC